MSALRRAVSASDGLWVPVPPIAICRLRQGCVAPSADDIQDIEERTVFEPFSHHRHRLGWVGWVFEVATSANDDA